MSPGEPVGFARPPTAPLVLLGLLTIVTFIGPFVLFLTIRGGDCPDWPPDRPVEWWVFGLVLATFLALMAACLTARFWAGTKKGPSS
jgi:hypothetical protein